MECLLCRKIQCFIFKTGILCDLHRTPFPMIHTYDKMAKNRLIFEQTQLNLKKYWKFENVLKVQRQWNNEFETMLQHDQQS
jgi:hypothetical protein